MLLAMSSVLLNQQCRISKKKIFSDHKGILESAKGTSTVMEEAIEKTEK